MWSLRTIQKASFKVYRETFILDNLISNQIKKADTKKSKISI